MAEILIKAVAPNQPDAAKLARCYAVGDPVVVMPDGHEWGAAEGLPTFWIVKVPGVSVETASAYLERAQAAARRREWNLDPTDLPVGVRDTLLTTGVITVTPAQVVNFVKRKL